MTTVNHSVPGQVGGRYHFPWLSIEIQRQPDEPGVTFADLSGLRALLSARMATCVSAAQAVAR